MQMKSFVRILILLLCSPLASVTALAYCPVPEIRANGEFFKSDVVLTGTVISQRYTNPEGEDAGGWYYEMRAAKVLKGPIQKEFTVYTEDASARFSLEDGHDYLLFAYRAHGRLEIYGCGNSAPLSKASESLRQIQTISVTPDGEIEGWIAEETTGVHLSGIHVVVRGGPQVYRAVTDKDGWFHFRVPKGQYEVDFSNHEYYLNEGDVFWYDPKRFTVHAGETAAVQMVSVRHPDRR
jgi:Carboxypeptidase regulatory-like domain